MGGRRPRAAWGLPGSLLIGTALAFQGCSLIYPPQFPDVDRTSLTSTPDIAADPKVVDELLAAFRKADDALKRQDLDALMRLYSDGYRHRGMTKADLRAAWGERFRRYRELASLHLFSRIMSARDQMPLTAEITCIGSLWGISRETGERENIDSWFSEVHDMALENGEWRIRGHAWDSRRPSRDSGPVGSPHPFF